MALTPPVTDAGYQSEVMLGAGLGESFGSRPEVSRLGERVREVDAIGAVAEVGDDLRARVVAVVPPAMPGSARACVVPSGGA